MTAGSNPSRSGRPTGGHRTALQWSLFAVVGGPLALMVVASLATGSPGVALVLIGLTAMLVGLAATAIGRARWAFIASRKLGALVAGVGLVTLIGGGLATPATAADAETASAEHVPSTPTSTATPTASTEAAAVAADADATTAESQEKALPVDVLATSAGQLSDTAAAKASTTAVRSSALAALEAVPVKGRAPKTGYTREQFGAAWSDVDRNGCDTRNDILARDLTGKTVKLGTHHCVVLTGILADPYAPSSIHFVRGPSSTAVQIDHVVALSDAWQKGAQQWDVTRRTALANDPVNLLAVDGPLNEAKGDGDAATWLPPNTAFRCAYVARQTAVKVKYGLWMTQAEKDAIATILTTCPSEPLPDGVVAFLPAPSPTTKTSAPSTRPTVAVQAPAIPAQRSSTPPPAPAAPTAAPDPQPAAPAAAPAAGVVHPGSFCAPEGGVGVTVKGTTMICSTKTGDPRARWRAA